MDDLISRQVLLAEKFASLECALQANKDANFDVYKRGWNDALQTVYDNAPSVQQWIPVEKETPILPNIVLVCDSLGKILFDSYIDGSWTYCPYVVAWMPLPKPYKEETNG